MIGPFSVGPSGGRSAVSAPVSAPVSFGRPGGPDYRRVPLHQPEVAPKEPTLLGRLVDGLVAEHVAEVEGRAKNPMLDFRVKRRP